MKGMSLIVRTVARFISGLIFLFGIYIVLHGHLTPGGGFAGGVIMGGAFILLILARGLEEMQIELRKAQASIFESCGIFIFWLISMLGLLGGSYFFLNLFGKGRPLQMFSAGIIPLCNIGIGLEVGAALLSIFITLAVLKMGSKR